MRHCVSCGEEIAVSYDGGYCEDCAGDNLPTACDRSIELDWQTSTEHTGLQGVAFPEAATTPEQGALL
jgi:hypothetical protein